METLSLFADDLDFQNVAAPKLTSPKTEGIKYAGSKLKLLPHILGLVSKVRMVSLVTFVR